MLLVHITVVTVADAGDKVPADVKSGIEEKITALKTEKDKDDVDAIKKAQEALSTEIQKIGQYMNQQTEQPAGETPEEPGVRDAEVEENPTDESSPEGK